MIDCITKKMWVYFAIYSKNLAFDADIIVVKLSYIHFLPSIIHLRYTSYMLPAMLLSRTLND